MRIQFVKPESAEDRKFLRGLGYTDEHFRGPGCAVIAGSENDRKLRDYIKRKNRSARGSEHVR